MIETMNLAMNLAIFIGAALIAISVFTSFLSFRFGTPLLLVFLLVGLLAGEDGIGGIRFNDANTAHFVGSLALAIILFDSGFHTRWQTVRAAAWPSVTLATVGVVMTIALVGTAAHFLLGVPWLESLLMGAIISSTDAAAVFFLLRVGGITIRERVRSTLEIESGSNDAMAIFLTVALIELIITNASVEELTWGLAQALGLQMGIGALGGVAGGWFIVQAVNRTNFEQGLYPIIVMSLALCLFSATSMLGGSGFLAVYIAGLFAGNARLRFAGLLRRFQNGMTWLCQIGMFLTLGLFAMPSQFFDIAPQAIALALFLTFIGRPLAVWLCLLPFGFSRNETTFIAWVGLRGAVSILLAILPIIGGLEAAQTFFNTAFIVVVVSLLIQGWTIRQMAQWLGLIVPPRTGPVDRIELELPGRANHELVVYRIVPDSPVTKGERIPRWARPSLIVRNGQSMPLHRAGKLQPRDLVFTFIVPERVYLLDRLFASPIELDARDHEFYGDFTLSPDAELSSIGAAYGFKPKESDADLNISELLTKELGGSVEIGDRLHYGTVELIVRNVVNNVIDEIGLAVEPTRPSRPRLPLFQTRKDFEAYLRRWHARRERRKEAQAGRREAIHQDRRQDPLLLPTFCLGKCQCHLESLAYGHEARPSGRPQQGRRDHPLDVTRGDRILFSKWSGTEVKIDGEELLIMKESDILGIVDR